ncbi:hypothetical protein Agub_g15980, partial [Astrephomene gubernaculifera]
MAPKRKSPENLTLLGRLTFFLQKRLEVIERQICGGEGVEGVYGSLTIATLTIVLLVLVRAGLLRTNSVFGDIGAGVGRTLVIVAFLFGIKSIGWELDKVKRGKAENFIERFQPHVDKYKVKDPWNHLEADVNSLLTAYKTPECFSCKPDNSDVNYEDVTVLFSFWEGFGDKEKVTKHMKTATQLEALIIVQKHEAKPVEFMAGLGFPGLTLLTRLPIRTSGANQTFQAYIFLTSLGKSNMLPEVKIQEQEFLPPAVYDLPVNDHTPLLIKMMQEDEQAKKARTLIPPKEAIIAPSPNAQQGQEDDAFEQLAEEPQQDCAALGTATLQPASADFSDVLPTTEHNKAPQLDPVQQDGTQ